MEPPRHDAPTPARAAVVVNPVKVDVAALRQLVAEQEERLGWAPATWFETSAGDDGRSAAEAALGAGPRLLVVAGGDGTLRAVAEVAAGRGTPLGLVPAGTGNLFARELGLPLNALRSAVETAFGGRDRPVDVGTAQLGRPDGTSTSHAFLVMTGIGVDAHMAGHTDPRLKARIGWLAYSDPIARSVFGNRQFDMTYALDDEPPVSTRVHTVIVGNSGTLTAGILMIPDAVVDDGLLDAVVLRPGRGPGWTYIGYRLAFNRLLHRTGVGRVVTRWSPRPRSMRFAQARAMRVQLAAPQEIQIDGDPRGLVSEVAITVAHHALTVRVPTAG
ncbi:diacylglycerol/lipid kinase family protein [Frigoribacterium endophyticum]|uniref:diacylglycerol/lipid kinase family protein n=1 Tax=Frigoribacterium endophyticum TaxID=1522176 RepID=UPI003132F3D2|nr:diacylglycerol kinase family enzyme [Frigoribacterium endophyticum]